jgi:hypothetical protein
MIAISTAAMPLSLPCGPSPRAGRAVAAGDPGGVEWFLRA